MSLTIKGSTSVMQDKAECFICKKNGPLQQHHCFTSGRRKLADQDGLWVYLCPWCHSALHDKNLHEMELKKLAQEAYINELVKKGYPEDAAREAYFARYGKYYD